MFFMKSFNNLLYLFRIKKLINVIGAHLKTDADKRAYIELTNKLSTFDPNKIVRKRKA